MRSRLLGPGCASKAILTPTEIRYAGGGPQLLKEALHTFCSSIVELPLTHTLDVFLGYFDSSLPLG